MRLKESIKSNGLAGSLTSVSILRRGLLMTAVENCSECGVNGIQTPGPGSWGEEREVDTRAAKEGEECDRAISFPLYDRS